MKTKLQFQTLTAISVLLVSLAAASAQQTPPGRTTIVPANLPVLLQPPALQVGNPALDPATGLPLPGGTAEPQWIDNDWIDPDIVLTNVSFDGLPLSEVARQLRESFKDQFNMLPMPQTFGTNWGDTTISLQLKNVRASEVFNAMNLVFENDRTPLRWELKPAVGARPLVLLRVLPEAAPQTVIETRPAGTHRMVYFVGDLIGDEKTGGMTMEQIVKTILDVWPADFGKPDGVIQFHDGAQLLVVNGTPDQLEFIHQTLAALEQKAALARHK